MLRQGSSWDPQDPRDRFLGIMNDNFFSNPSRKSSEVPGGGHNCVDLVLFRPARPVGSGLPADPRSRNSSKMLIFEIFYFFLVCSWDDPGYLGRPHEAGRGPLSPREAAVGPTSPAECTI